MVSLKARSLVAKLTWITMSAALALTLLAGYSLYDAFNSYQRFTRDATDVQLTRLLKAQFEEDGDRLVDTLERQLGRSVSQQDFNAIRETLRGIQRYDNLDYAMVFDTDFRLLHDGTLTVDQLGATPYDLGVDIPSEPLGWSGDSLSLVRPISSAGDEPMGYLVLQLDHAEAMEKLARHQDELEQAAMLSQRGLLIRTALVSLSGLFLIFMSVWYLARHTLSPILELTRRTTEYGSGDTSISFSIDQGNEVGQLSEALENMRVRLESNHQKTIELAYFDGLTQLPNRHWFQSSIDRLIDYSQHHQQRLAVLFIDLDHFKEVNDTAGHDVGDILLAEAAIRLRGVMQKFDVTDPTSAEIPLARLGGDEFVAILPDLRDAGQLSDFASEIVSALTASFDIGDRFFSVTASVGITVFPDDAVTAHEILKSADIAMYAAKQAGRNRYAFYSHQMDSELQNRVGIVEDVRKGLLSRMFHIEYQPIINLETDRIVAAEALLRWKHPEKGYISPALFIPLIEETDLIEPVTEMIVEQVLTDLGELLKVEPEFRVSVNVSGASLHRESTRNMMARLKADHEIPDQRLCVELTETSMIRHLEECQDTLSFWRERGIMTWIDDFGTGYSSLSYLHQLPIDGVKIDSSFVRDLREGSDHSLVKSIIALGHTLNIPVVAEGVETLGQKADLRQLSCDYAQGYGLHRPVLFQAMAEKLRVQGPNLSARRGFYRAV